MAETKIGECGCCQVEAVRVRHSRGGGVHNEGLWLCAVCAQTQVSCAHRYPEQYKGSVIVLKTIAYCTNLILKKLEELKHG